MVNKFVFKNRLFPKTTTLNSHNRFFNISVIRTEFIRKSIHFLIALSPVLAAWNRFFTLIMLMAGVLVYVYLESMRIRGFTIPLISSLTAQASRSRDEGHFVLGPVTLGLGAVLVLAFFPLRTASIAIYALAFGDGFASLVGKPFGRIKPSFMMGKSVEGSAACLAAVFLVTWKVSRSLPVSLTAAVTAVIAEVLPLEDLDNLVIPLAVACAISIAML